MATSGAMADFGRMPTSRKIMVFVIIGLLAGVLYWKLVYTKLVESRDKAKALHTSNMAANKTLEDDIPKFNELRAKKDMLDEIIKQQQKALPTEAEVPAFFQFVEQKATEAGVDILKWNKKPEEPVERFVKVPLDVELTGNFLQLKRFFASLIEKKQKPADKGTVQERDRIVSIENLSLTNPNVRNREIVLTARFTAVTYRQGDAPPPDPKKPGENNAAPPPAAGSAPPALPSTGSTPPPLPSAGTPQGAKVRTEEALDKGMERTKDGIDKAGGSAGTDRLKGGQ